MASNTAPKAVKAVHPANVMPPASDGKSTPDIVEQLRQLEREVLLRNSELQGRLDALEPETEVLKQDTTVLKQDTEAARETLDTLTKALADLEIHLGDTHTRTESLEAITRSLNESGNMISRLLDDAIARVNSRADHQDERLADNAESIQGLESRNRALDQLLDEMDGRLTDTAESVTAVDLKHSDFYEKLNNTLVSAANKLKAIDQHQDGQITGLTGRLDTLEPAHAGLDQRHRALEDEAGALQGRLDTLEPAHAELDRRHETLKDETGTLRGRVDVLEPAQKTLKSAHNSLAVHVSGLDVRADRTDDHLRKGAWTAGLVALLLAVAAGTALWKGYDNRGSLMAAVTAQGDWIKNETANLWTSLATLTRQTEAVDDRVDTMDARVAAVDTRTTAVNARVEDVAADLGGKVSVIEGRIYASDEALNGTPVDMSTIRGEDWLASLPAGHYLVQLLGAYSKRSLANLIARHRDTLDIDQFSYIHTTNNGRDWFVLLYGNYADFDAAMAAMDSLPQRLQKSGPYVRTVAGALKSAARS